MTDKQDQRAATERIEHADYIELLFHEASRQAVDDLIAHLIDIINVSQTGEHVRIFVNNGDLRRGQPISYLIGQLRAHKQYFDIPFRARIAANFNLMPIAQLIELFLRSLYSRKITFKPFMVTDTDGALEWLLKD